MEVRSSEGLGRTRLPHPLIPDGFELPHVFGLSLNLYETLVFVEATSIRVLREGVKV